MDNNNELRANRQRRANRRRQRGEQQQQNAERQVPQQDDDFQRLLLQLEHDAQQQLQQAQRNMEQARERTRRSRFEHAELMHRLDPTNYPAPQRPADMPIPTNIMEAVQQYSYSDLTKFLEQGHDANAVFDGETALSYAIRTDSSYGIITTLLENGADANVILPPPINQTALVYAVRENMSYGIISNLLEHGANPNTVSRRGSRSALEHALRNDASYGIICSLLDRGADPNLVSDNRDSPLILAVRRDMSYGTISKLLEANADPNAVDGNGESALILAFRNNSFSAIRVLLDHGANHSALDMHGVPVFVLAAKSKSYNTWISLLNHGANINASDFRGWTGLMHLCHLPFSPSTNDDNEEDNNPFLQLIREQNRQLAIMEAETNQRFHQAMEDLGLPSASLRVRRNQYERDFEMDWALSQGTRSPVCAFVSVSDSININMTARDGRTACLIACESGRIEHLPILQNAGADFFARTHNGETAVHLAAASGHRGVVKWLLEKYPNLLYEADRRGRHALHCALLKSHTSVARAIMESLFGVQDDVVQCLVRATDHNGNSALPMAARLGSIRTVNALLPFANDVEICKAQVETRSGRGNSLIRLSIHHTLLCALVEQHGWFNRPGFMGPLPRHSGRL